eukprot:5999166-Amphidinium_carterae.1
MLLETATPAEMWLRRQTGHPRFSRRGKPRRWNGLTTSSNLGYYNYWRTALDRDSWRSFAQRFSSELLGKLRIPLGQFRESAQAQLPSA